MGVFKKGVLIKLFGAVIKDTPVLTGRLRGNWQFTVGKPAATSPTSVDNPIETVTAGVQAKVTDKDGVYNLTNNMHYAHRIEYEGWSKVKAPHGMVRRNMVRIANLLQSEVRR